jgi:hypothetical protein
MKWSSILNFFPQKRKLEYKLKQFNDELEKQVRQKTAEILQSRLMPKVFVSLLSVSRLSGY